ncbi:MAG TPA: UDP-3-O-(3-hydroxymyristoyl)glucosamine N-acyltransferase [Ferruginibacter sp.]|jgi:UDP-3-O-[3-hydroxymyristoyl] glucosamine N-acyltransferase|nr:UDP-3-O-(3-hydroxymyristoyl)glucosamine N-acyltransferase [Ferruginibacter sp.]HRO05192.1 UDP-3-O-(3-hydroxymyristoyl)glucosamine N-acyltransferase [Ferruginibacter sp.]HRO95503.1 UDP-3-O-(3-hydroxymyristoyl)glucosamine N-acyltransferase [Ferruginibacter sp.]HRP50284.1 UDP-3-O-(3-hydroxymyristoyl)glucosamine N-acyltransferase [Ferruginibacter sp.]
MRFTAGQVAAIINGKIEGDAEQAVTSFGKIEEAREGQLAFLANPKYEDFLYTSGASVIIISNTLELRQPISATIIRVADPYSSFAALLDKYQELKTMQLTGIQQPVFMQPTVKLGEDVYLGAFVYLGENVTIGNRVKIFPQTYIGDNVTIGDDSILHPGVKIYHHCVVGKNVKIHAGAVIGSDGFGFAPQADGTFLKVPQIGNVVIEDNVEIGSNATIDRATMGSTLIKSGAKLDNLIQVAHNVEVGNNTVIAAQAGVSGSTKIGNNVMIGGQAGIVGHLQIADGTKINAQSGVSKSIKTPNTAVTGSPAFEYTSALRSQALNRNLPELEKRISELEQIIKSLRTSA